MNGWHWAGMPCRRNRQKVLLDFKAPCWFRERNPMEFICSQKMYPLVMTNIAKWKITPFLSSVNHLFLWAIFHNYVNVYQKVSRREFLFWIELLHCYIFRDFGFKDKPFWGYCNRCCALLRYRFRLLCGIGTQHFVSVPLNRTKQGSVHSLGCFTNNSGYQIGYPLVI